MQPDATKQSMDDDLLMIEDDSDRATAQPDSAAGWLLLVVDDDEDVHQATALALRGLEFEGRGLQLLHAHSAAEAAGLIAAHEELAVVLLDVVMETEDAGLQLVRHIRETLGRQALRIILRTGQPGYAPELATIRDYDINDYRTKSELSRVRLYTSLTTAIRSYRQMRAEQTMREGLEQVVRASTELTRLHGMRLFAEGLVAQLCALLQVAPEGLVCAQDGPPCGSEPARVIAAAGQYRDLLQQPLEALPQAAVREALEDCLRQRRSCFEGPPCLFFDNPDTPGLAAYLALQRPLLAAERHLLEVFCASLAVGFANVLLYERLHEQAYLDPLLHIGNLNSVLEQLAQASREAADSTLAVLDIDGFSAINDALGHEFGDAVLLSVARRLASSLAHSSIARVGSDVFAILGPEAEVAPAPLLALFDMPFRVADQQLRLSTTIGLVRLSSGRSSGSALLKDAHLALKQAKLRLRGSASYFSESMGQDVRERMRLLANLREAFQTQHFFLVYQPKISLASGRAEGVEALLRWRMQDGQLVPPDRFIPIAEQAGMMVALGTFVLRSACQQLARLRAAGHLQLKMAINLSLSQLRENDFVSVLQQAMADAGVPAERIELEITESLAAENLDTLAGLLQQIRSLGVSLAIDDFGTGFSSLSVLRCLPVQRLKIDRSFITEMASDDSIARMVISLGHSLGLQITAEGVETPAQADALQALGCDEGQGWLYARALEEEALLAWLAQTGRD